MIHGAVNHLANFYCCCNKTVNICSAYYFTFWHHRGDHAVNSVKIIKHNICRFRFIPHFSERIPLLLWEKKKRNSKSIKQTKIHLVSYLHLAHFFVVVAFVYLQYNRFSSTLIHFFIFTSIHFNADASVYSFSELKKKYIYRVVKS